MLDDDAGGLPVAKFRHQLQRRVGIVVIVVAEFLALHLLRLGDPAAVGPKREIKRRLLVRILAVAQRLPPLHRQRQDVREELPLVAEREPLRDRRIVDGGGGKGLCRQIFAEIE